ncbi:MAG: MFS transporter [Acidimicrobiales bacterium]
MSGRSLGGNYRRLWTASVVSNLGDGLALVAYPWLASSITRSPIAIAGVAVATRLPWLLFTLPAGVITDRVDRRRLVAGMDTIRFVLTLVVGLIVLVGSDGLADPAALADGSATGPSGAALALVLLYLAALALGSAEVLRDNSAQTLLPAIVAKEDLERANGRMWGAEMVMNAFVGPPLAGVLIGVSLALPFLVDAGTFALAAALVASMTGTFRPTGEAPVERPRFRTQLAEGFRWLWGHDLLRSLAIALGLLNALGAMTSAVDVLFAQDVLGLSATGFGLLAISGAVGGVVGSVTGSWISDRLGSGGVLALTMLGSAAAHGAIAVVPSVPLVFAAFVLVALVGVAWNVVTVALRQTIVPDALLGRVNSVYRFFGWGMIPIGSLVGGVLVTVVDAGASREIALRTPHAVAAVAHLLVFAWAASRLSTAKIEAARSAATGPGGATGS